MTDSLRNAGAVGLLAAAALVLAGCGPGAGHGVGGQDRALAANSLVANAADRGGWTDIAVEDRDLAARVREAIFGDPELRAQDLDVTVEDGVVTVSGVVDSTTLRERTVALADSVEGVVLVEDRLFVRGAPD